MLQNFAKCCQTFEKVAKGCTLVNGEWGASQGRGGFAAFGLLSPVELEKEYQS